MAKLFALEDIQDTLQENYVEEVDTIDSIEENLTSEIRDAENSFNIVTESIKTLQNQFNLITDIKSSLESKKLASVDYFISIENLSPVMKSIADNLGVDYKTPSLEDFKNPYSIETCHQIAMEGFVEFIKSIWEKIKDFLIELLKKIRLFFNRLFNFDLQLNEYERYVDKMISDIKSDKYVLSNNKAIIQSRLPSMLGKDGMERMDTDYLLNYGLPKVDNLHNILVGIAVELPKSVKNIVNELDSNIKTHNNDIIDNLSNLLNNYKKLRESYKNNVLNPDHIANISWTIIPQINLHLSPALKELNNRNLINNITSGEFFTTTSELNEVPDSVFDKIQTTLNTSVNDSNTTIFKLINDKDIDQELPYSYNVYLVIVEDTYDDDDDEPQEDNTPKTNNTEKITKIKYLTISNKDEIVGIANELNPLSNKDNLIELYNIYKNKYNKLNIKSVSNAISSNSKFEELINKNKKTMIQIADTIEEIEDIVKSLVLRPEVFGGASNINIEELNKSKYEGILTIRKYSSLFNKYSNTIIGLMQFITQFMKTSGYDTISIYVEVRYELIKYIYNNCRLYHK